MIDKPYLNPQEVEYSCSELTARLRALGVNAEVFVIRQEVPTLTEDGRYFCHFRMYHPNAADVDFNINVFTELIRGGKDFTDDGGFHWYNIRWEERLMAYKVLSLPDLCLKVGPPCF